MASAPLWLRVLRAGFARPAVQIGLTILLVSAAWASATLLPVEHRTTEVFSLPGVDREGGCGYTKNFTVPTAATIDFRWQANTSGLGTFALIGIDPVLLTTYSPYAELGRAGGANLTIAEGITYYFQYCSNFNESVSGTAEIAFLEPILWGF